MSIFKGTINDTIAAQLKAREKVVSTESNRDPDFLRYTTGKNGWVRMSSFVNYDSKRYDVSTGRLIDDGKYKGDNLAKKYVLEGGTLYNQRNNIYSLRAGVGNLDGVYASNIDKIENNPASNKVDRLYGLRPMPGITSVNINNKSAYGSLREATIQFYAWDKHQLEELEILYMRTGYTVFLEWGWSEYIDHGNAPSINTYPSNIKVENFNTLTLNPFQPGWTEEAIYTRIDNDIIKTKGNYDALLGFVKNFSWQLMPNGGFQCSTTLISRGEIIETLKVSSNNNVSLGSPPKTTTKEAPAFAYSNFEKIFLNIIGHINETEFVPSIELIGSGLSDEATGALSFPGASENDQKALRDQSDQVWNDISTRLSDGIFKEARGSWDKYDIVPISRFNLSQECFVKLCDGKTEGTFIEYISMDAFISIINEFFIPYNLGSDEKNKVAYIVIPNITPCLASVDSVSIDPTTCIIQNSQATFITDQVSGFSPEVFSEINSVRLSPNTSPIPAVQLPEFLYSGTKNVGQIGNIYISINKLINLYRNIGGEPNGVDILDLLQEVLDACSFALGGINDFKYFSSKNIIQIIDVKYFENAKPSSKFKFDLIGLKSICRDVKINSRIFSEQSTMIGIAAGSGDTQNNLGDIYSSTQAYFNTGLEDRLVRPTFNNTTVPPTLFDYQKAIFNNISSLTNYINRNVLGSIIGNGTLLVTHVPQDNEIINAASLLKTFLYQFNGPDVDFKALIPFELEITLDGIGGLIVGQIFTIDKSILPKDYVNKNLGFVITGISHTLQNNDWITNIKTQICLLDNESIAEKFVIDKSKLKEIVEKIRVESAQNGYLFCAIADYMIENYINIVSNFGNEIDKELVDDFALNLKNIYNDVEKMEVVVPNISKDIETIKNYLTKWYTTVSNDNTIIKPNFPSTFDDFVTPSKAGTPIDTYKAISNLLLSAGAEAEQLSRKNRTLSIEALKDIWSNTFFGKIESSGVAQLFPIPNKEIIFPDKTISDIVQDFLSGINPLTKNPDGSSFSIDRLKTIFPNSSFRIKEGIRTVPITGLFGIPDFDIRLSSYYRFDIKSFDTLFQIFYTYLLNDSNFGTTFSSFGAPPFSNTGTASFSIINLVNVK